MSSSDREIGSRGRQFPGICGPNSLAKLMKFKATESLCLRQKADSKVEGLAHWVKEALVI